MDKEEKAIKGHALILPYPAQGHINPMLQFAKRLVSKGVKATIANTKHINNSMNTNSLPKFILLETISDGFDEGGYNQAKTPQSYSSTFKVVGSQSLANLIKKLNDVNVLIYDGFLPWALDVAKELGLVGVAFFTQSCAVSNFYYHVHKGAVPVPLPGAVDSVPGLPVLQVSETPSFVSDPRKYPAFYDMLVNQFINIHQADWILHTSFHAMEEEVLEWMGKRWKLRTIGPTIPSMYLDKRIEDDENYGINLFNSSFPNCIDWLNDKPKGSVVYLSYGSLAEVESEQMEELAYVLKSSNFHFLWVVREPEQSKLPVNFKEEINSEKGLVVTWCPQLDVLANEAIGCFVTHGGFNSVVEALSLGVPMVVVPQWSDQPTNAKYVEDIWKIGIRAWPDEDGILRRQTLEVCINEIMEGERGKEIKKNAGKWKILAKQAMDEGGSSDKNIDEFIAQIIPS